MCYSWCFPKWHNRNVWKVLTQHHIKEKYFRNTRKHPFLHAWTVTYHVSRDVTTRFAAMFCFFLSLSDVIVSNKSCNFWDISPGEGGGGCSQIKVIGMLVVSLWGVNYGVWDGKLLYLLIQVSLITVHKEIYKKCPDTDHTEISLGGQLKLEPHPHWSPVGSSLSLLYGVLPGTFLFGALYLIPVTICLAVPIKFTSI